jgi:hypothetical protein
VLVRLGRLVEELVGELRAFDPDLLSGDECAELVECFARGEKALAAARARAALRAAGCEAHRERGFHDPADWVARATGSTARDARVELETTERLASCPATQTAVAAGDVSVAQAGEIVRTVAVVPGSEAELLELARTASMSSLRDRARKRRLGAVSADALHGTQRAAREVVHWRDELGMVCGRFRLTPDAGVPLVNRLDRATARARREAKRHGTAERWEAHAADAFAAMIAANEPASPDKSGTRAVDLVLVCDLNAWWRGHAHPGDACHIVGGGPIPVTLARELARDAFLKVVLHDGVAIHTVAHLGRRISAEVRTALELGGLPDLDGIVCIEEGCDRRYHLEWDHRDPLANGGPTSYENLEPRCKAHHWEKTERDRKAGLLNGGRDGGKRPP